MARVKVLVIRHEVNALIRGLLRDRLKYLYLFLHFLLLISYFYSILYCTLFPFSVESRPVQDIGLRHLSSLRADCPTTTLVTHGSASLGLGLLCILDEDLKLLEVIV